MGSSTGSAARCAWCADTSGSPFLLVTLPILFEEDVVHGIVAVVDDASPFLVFVVNTLAGAVVGSVVALVEVMLASRLAMRKPDPAPATESPAEIT